MSLEKIIQFSSGMYPSSLGTAAQEEFNTFEEGYDNFWARYNGAWPGDQQSEWSPSSYAPSSFSWMTTHFQCLDPSEDCSPIAYSHTDYECLNPSFSVHREITSCEKQSAGNLGDGFESGDAPGFCQTTQQSERSPSSCAPASISWMTAHAQYIDPWGDCSPIAYSHTDYECLNPSFSVHQEITSCEKQSAGNPGDVFECGDALGFGQRISCQMTLTREMSACLEQASDPETQDHSAIHHTNPSSSEATLMASKGLTGSGLYGDVGGAGRPAKLIHERDAYRIPCPSGSKDRHCRVLTSKGPRERRIRLSKETALKFYDVQHRLGYDQASKAVDWLIHKSKSAIDELPQISSADYRISPCLQSSSGSVSPFQTGQAVSAASQNPGFVLKNGELSSGGFSAKIPSGSSSGTASPCTSNKMSFKRASCKDHSDTGKYSSVEPQKSSAVSLQSRQRIKEAYAVQRTESRAKARERARERTKQKIRSKASRKLSHFMDEQLSYETNQFPSN